MFDFFFFLMSILAFIVPTETLPGLVLYASQRNLTNTMKWVVCLSLCLLGDSVPNWTWRECSRSEWHFSNFTWGDGQVFLAVRANGGWCQSRLLTSLENETFLSEILRLLVCRLLVKSAAGSWVGAAPLFPSKLFLPNAPSYAGIVARSRHFLRK